MVIDTGLSSPEILRSIEPFESPDAARAWCEREEIGQTPTDVGEWAAVVPLAQPASSDG